MEIEARLCWTGLMGSERAGTAWVGWLLETWLRSEGKRGR